MLRHRGVSNCHSGKGKDSSEELHFGSLKDWYYDLDDEEADEQMITSAGDRTKRRQRARRLETDGIG